MDIYTDGSCLNNPGPGGWAAILVSDDGKRPLSGGEQDTTNNRMELLAAIKGLEAVPPGSPITVHSWRNLSIGLTMRWIGAVGRDGAVGGGDGESLTLRKLSRRSRDGGEGGRRSSPTGDPFSGGGNEGG